VYDNISRYGFEIVDATCPFVKKAQRYARLLSEKGYQVLILGDKNHPEVRGIMSFAGKDAKVVGYADPLPKLKPKVGIVVQTTQSVEALKKLLSEVIEKSREVKVYNTICSSTSLRLKETAGLAKKVDLMIVVGGKNSANTSQLANLCRSLNVKTHHIETAAELRREWFEKVRRVGITAGASTPEWLIEEIHQGIIKMEGESGDEH